MELPNIQASMTVLIIDTNNLIHFLKFLQQKEITEAAFEH
jgi:hypothetical protein